MNNNAINTAEPWQVCGVIVQGNVAKIDAIRTALLQLPETEVHAVNAESGKIVAVMQGQSQKALAKRMEQARDIDGVITVSLVYHEIEQ